MDELLSLHEALRAAITDRWQRSLPFADELLDRWERAAYLGFGTGSSVYDSSLILGDVGVGDHTWIGPHTVLDGTGGPLSIGSYCMISSGAQVYTHHTVEWALTGGAAGPRRGPVSIGHRTYIGPQAVIGLGVDIGTQVVIGAGAFVNRDVPDGAIAYGTPARIVGRTEVSGDRVDLVYDEPR